MVWALERLEIITAGHEIVVRTDHAALLPILTGQVKNVSTPRVERLRLKLNRFVHTGLHLQHVPGKLNQADPLSRPSRRKPLACSDKQALPIAPGSVPIQGGEGGGAQKNIAPIMAGKAIPGNQSDVKPRAKRKRGRPRKHVPAAQEVEAPPQKDKEDEPQEEATQPP